MVFQYFDLSVRAAASIPMSNQAEAIPTGTEETTCILPSNQNVLAEHSF